jgi:hypothetical protein
VNSVPDLLLEAVWGVVRPPPVEDLADASVALGPGLQGVLDTLQLEGATIPHRLKRDSQDGFRHHNANYPLKVFGKISYFGSSKYARDSKIQDYYFRIIIYA